MIEKLEKQQTLSNLETQLLGNENWLNLDLLKQESISPHISDMLFVSNYIPKYLNDSEFSYDNSLNNVFHFGLDFANFLLILETTRLLTYNLRQYNDSIMLRKEFTANPIKYFSDN